MTRSLNHRTTHHTTRMLGGVPRPRQPDYLAIYCRAMEEVLKIDKRLLPFFAEQKRLADQLLHDQEVQAALDKIYGNPPGQQIRSVFNSQLSVLTQHSESEFLRQEKALFKSHLVLLRLQENLRNR